VYLAQIAHRIAVHAGGIDAALDDFLLRPRVEPPKAPDAELGAAALAALGGVRVRHVKLKKG
jgi:hypothetical protein